MPFKRLPALICLLFLFQTPALHAGDPGVSPVKLKLRETPRPLYPKIQRDAHSCGFLALAAIYEAYGINVHLARLRERLGTNEPAIPFLSDSNGTIQPDLFRVLEQDGFMWEVVNPASDSGRQDLLEHLAGPHYALTLIKRKPTGTMHWVVITDARQDRLVVADSLIRGLKLYKLEEYRNEQILSSILLEPDPDGPGSFFYFPHTHGVWEMLDTWVKSFFK